MGKGAPAPFDPEFDDVLNRISATVPPAITPDLIAGFRAIAPDPTVGGAAVAGRTSRSS